MTEHILMGNGIVLHYPSSGREMPENIIIACEFCQTQHDDEDPNARQCYRSNGRDARTLFGAITRTAVARLRALDGHAFKRSIAKDLWRVKESCAIMAARTLGIDISGVDSYIPAFECNSSNAF